MQTFQKRQRGFNVWEGTNILRSSTYIVFRCWVLSKIRDCHCRINIKITLVYGIFKINQLNICQDCEHLSTCEHLSSSRLSVDITSSKVSFFAWDLKIKKFQLSSNSHTFQKNDGGTTIWEGTSILRWFSCLLVLRYCL